MKITVDTTGDSVSELKRLVSLLQSLIAEREGGSVGSDSSSDFTPMFGAMDTMSTPSTPSTSSVEPEKPSSEPEPLTFIPYE